MKEIIKPKRGSMNPVMIRLPAEVQVKADAIVEDYKAMGKEITVTDVYRTAIFRFLEISTDSKHFKTVGAGS
jgi:hypothetical protein